jgi:cobalamin biosynthesis Mg chelatase CobN
MADRIVKDREETGRGDDPRTARAGAARDGRIVVDREEARQAGTARDSATGTRHDEPVVETREEARQGETWAPMQWVLIGSVALVVIAFAIIYFAFFG